MSMLVPGSGAAADAAPAGDAPAASPVAIAIHGGAGTISREAMTPEREARIRAALTEAARAGHAVLREGGTALDAVTAAITLLEDAPEFNAGRGAVLTSEGRVEMDASLMTGHDLEAGAVAGVRGIRHPILAARAVLEDSPHVMLVGRGAEDWARRAGLEFKDDDWFITPFRSEQLERLRSAEAGAARQDEAPWYSTVGAVALDAHGNLAAGTSTGGMSNKRFGRVGDSPIIGAGTYADNASCAVSATGHGEFFIRHVVAYRICAGMTLAGQGLAESADAVVNGLLTEVGGDGGVIALDARGRIAMPFNTPGMYRARIGVDGRLDVAIYGDE
ncbi:isoaspartyl peptidase/L-asparaginase [Wenzhouxiangella sp. XN79A]|nr:isoaspartyl peptidase/L-asparaginase [Wenzhouxiangella sp. XN79A]